MGFAFRRRPDTCGLDLVLSPRPQKWDSHPAFSLRAPLCDSHLLLSPIIHLLPIPTPGPFSPSHRSHHRHRPLSNKTIIQVLSLKEIRQILAETRGLVEGVLQVGDPLQLKIAILVQILHAVHEDVEGRSEGHVISEVGIDALAVVEGSGEVIIRSLLLRIF